MRPLTARRMAGAQPQDLRARSQQRGTRRQSPRRIGADAPAPGSYWMSQATQSDRRGTTVFGRDAKNKTTQTQRSTMSLYRNSPVRLHAMGSVDKLHLTAPGVVKKNDHVMIKVPTPIKEPIADRMGMNAPTASNVAVVSSTTPRRLASPLIPNMDNQETNGLLEIYRAMPCADWSVNFCVPNEIKIRTITHLRMASSQ